MIISRADYPRSSRRNVGMGLLFSHIDADNKLKSNRYLSFGANAILPEKNELVSIVHKKSGENKLCTTSQFDTIVGIVGYGVFVDGTVLQDRAVIPHELRNFTVVVENASKQELIFIGVLSQTAGSYYALLDPNGYIRTLNAHEFGLNYNTVRSMGLVLHSI